MDTSPRPDSVSPPLVPSRPPPTAAQPTRGGRPPRGAVTDNQMLARGGTTSEEVFQRILRKLQREENFATVEHAKKRAGHTAEEGGSRALSMLTRDDRADAMQFKERMTEGERMRAEDLAKEESRFGEDPSPGTLRVLVDSVKSSVNQKLELATMTSVKQTMKLVFECRTLLDKLLKDIPLHGNFVELDQSNRPNPTKLKELYNEFKQAPIVLPTARYAPDETTGRLLPQLVERSAAANQQQLQQSQLQGMATMDASDMHGLFANASMEQMQQMLAPNNMLVVPKGSVFASSLSGSPGSMSPRDQQLVLRHLRRVAQSVAVATQTDETMAKQYSEREYNRQVKRAERLEVIKSEYEGIISKLHVQLETSRAALNRRSQIVGYLRDTLYRDTCLLRNQLNALQMRTANTKADITEIGIDHTRLHSLLDTVMLAVEKDRVMVGPDGDKLALNDDDKLKRAKVMADDKCNRLRRQLVETKQKCELQIQRKSRELRNLKLASDVGKLKTVMVDLVGGLKMDLQGMRHDVKSALTTMKTTMFNMSTEIEYHARKASAEVSTFRHARASQRAVQDALGAMDDLLTPVMKPEFATGSHPWGYSRHPDPMTSYITQAHGEEIAEACATELRCIQKHFYALQRFSLYVHAQPDRNRHAFGRPLQLLIYRMLASPQCTPDRAGPLRTALEKDFMCAGQRARVNLSYKYFTYRKNIHEQRARAALEAGGYDPEATPIPRSPALREIVIRLDDCRAKKKAVEANRSENARAVYTMWRSWNIDIFDGKRAPITKDPDSVWAPAPPMSKAKRNRKTGGVSKAMSMSGKPGDASATASPGGTQVGEFLQSINQEVNMAMHDNAEEPDSPLSPRAS